MAYEKQSSSTLFSTATQPLVLGMMLNSVPMRTGTIAPSFEPVPLMQSLQVPFAAMNASHVASVPAPVQAVAQPAICAVVHAPLGPVEA